MLVLALFFVVFVSSAKGPERLETCKLDPLKDSQFCNSSLSIDLRVEDLIKKLTVAEKISFTLSTNPEIKRLSISSFKWGTEALHGVVQTDGHVATSFPQVINLGRTFDMENIHLMAKYISDEGRALSNLGLTVQPSFWSPNINVYRDPRWGRGQETPGEDVHLVQEYAKNFLNGMMKGDDPRYTKTICGAKHYDAYDLERWPALIPKTDRHHFNAIVTEQDLQETFLPPFKTAVEEEGLQSIMCSYNRINGVPACCNKKFLIDILRTEYGFDGHVVSDCGAIKDIHVNHKYVKTAPEAVQVALQNGMDLNCGGYYGSYLQETLDKKLISEEDLNVAVRRIIKNRIRLGEFNDWSDQPYRKLGEKDINTKEHQELAYKLAQESIVLLKNEKEVLPLDPKKYPSIAVIGPAAMNKLDMQGIYSTDSPPYIITYLEGIQEYVNKTYYSVGCPFQIPLKVFFEEAKHLSEEADATVLVMGMTHKTESEGTDRDELSFPGVQGDLIREIMDVSKGPVILVVVGGSPVSVEWEKENVDAIIFSGYPSQSGGTALADVIFGKYNPAGKLTTTVYPSNYTEFCDFMDMNMRPSEKCPEGRTYKFFTGTPIYKFGDGISYTTFDYSFSNTGKEVISKNNFKEMAVDVKVQNTGKRDGDHVILMYSKNLFNNDAPLKELIGFKRIHLKAGESSIETFNVKKSDFEYVNKSGIREFNSGNYDLIVGDKRKRIVVK